MKLYFKPGACALASHIALQETGLPFEINKVSAAGSEKKTADGRNFLMIIPKGYTPVLETQTGEVLTEGIAILQYIADRAPEKNLAPAPGSFERYRLQEWLTYVATEVHKTYSPLFSPATPEEYKKMVTESLRDKYDYLERHLSTHAYLMGSTFSVADAYLFVCTNWARMLKVDLSRYPSVLGFMERVGARPAVRAAMKAEGLI